VNKKALLPTPDEIDALLPQTQCGLCTYGACMPYAEAMVYEQAPINLCPPGGVDTLNALGEKLMQDASPFIHDMQQKAKPKMLAVIREDECIGCTKCIQACPVDAILGSAKQMHTVIADECTGCELCVAPCPVDCIDLLTFSENSLMTKKVDPNKKNVARIRFNNRQVRLEKKKKTKKTLMLSNSSTKRKGYIEAALARNAEKKRILTNT
jgi:electron transport complex protein RnfB